MSNPAPTLNQINAFNATQGTTIDFNIIGGTELVRSNKIYIYDLSDNSLICTHLYVSTESTHELPANTDGSIVYESGKSSADFVNGAQYYAQIQTFTDIAGTEGGSGLSVAKMFWCLVNPTLTITTIPSTISTTSYNISATYNANTSVVSNIIQQYQFNLYSATGSLLQSSGVIVGNGEQQGTSTAYDISYNFTGLNVGSSYYVTVDVTTTQGMNVNAQSSTFIVSIDTPTLGEATVVNNACDGYISVTSNLSSEYGGSGSGEIATFETDSVNDVSSLKVTLTPIQDLNGYDKPWVGGAGKNKLPTRADGYTNTTNGITVTFNSDGSVTLNGTATATAIFNLISNTASDNRLYLPQGDYILNGDSVANNNFWIGAYKNADSGAWTISSKTNSGAFSVDEGYYIFPRIRIGDGVVLNNVTIYPMIRLASVSDATYEPYENICPITGWGSVNVYDDSMYGGLINWNQLAGNSFRPSQTKNNVEYTPNNDGTFTLNGTANGTDWWTVTPFPTSSVTGHKYIYYDANGNGSANTFGLTMYGTSIPNRAYGNTAVIYTADGTNRGVGYYYTNGAVINNVTIKPVLVDLTEAFGAGNEPTIEEFKALFPLGYYSYNSGTTTTVGAVNGKEYRNVTVSLGTTVYGGTLDLVSGRLVVDKALSLIDETKSFAVSTLTNYTQVEWVEYRNIGIKSAQFLSDRFDTGEKLNGIYSSLAAPRMYFGLPTSVTTPAQAQAWFETNPTNVVYPLTTPLTYQLTPKQIQTLVGSNNVWSEQGDIELSYHIPITNLLVKRQDVDDVSGNWLTLYSQPITQASDMDFTFIDFLNQYGKTYKYALVPLLTQTQSGVEVEVEGGYTVSDEVQSIFDGVFIADSTGSQKCKANVGYGNVDMNQVVGSITPIGAKYPIVITNSQNQYHNGSISGTIVPDDYYFNGNLSRIDMVNKRNELEQFLTNKRAKIIKDWNGNIWLAMIMDNVSCTFNNNYGMGIVNFSTNWIEVGDPTNQQDLQATGLIDVGGA